MNPPAAWWCEAYGPPPDDAHADTWPRCFVWAATGPGRRCSTPDVCAHTMAAERHRVFARINELAADGDETFRYLADEFPTPEDLLGGPDGKAPEAES